MAQRSQEVAPATINRALAFLRRVFTTGIENLHWHDLRHTFASCSVMKGVDLRTVQELMGHTTITMTLRYSHLSPAHQLEAVQRLNRPPTGTSTKTPKVAVSGAAETSAASDSRAGDRGRTGDVQLGNRLTKSRKTMIRGRNR